MGPLAFPQGHERAAGELAESGQHDLPFAHHETGRAQRVAPRSIQADDRMNVAGESERPRAMAALDRVVPALDPRDHGRRRSA